MTRLFTALGLPADVSAQLATIAPLLPGVRRIEAHNLHVTLHFLGEGDTAQTARALEGVAAPAFALSVAGVAQIPMAAGGWVLWASVRENAELLALHAAVAAALAPLGFRPEARRYTPHITLAYCRHDAPADERAQFLARHANLALPDLPITHFGLYSSIHTGDTSSYACEQRFMLGPRG
ncbi:MAG TPA: RNA 2',3'-cyclic phosphodiesterase [Roseiflexaceae bacterium]|nr:RNA 2',3'-cyclic phosphodiesterase [Roseiflexaceae bacterium]